VRSWALIARIGEKTRIGLGYKSDDEREMPLVVLLRSSCLSLTWLANAQAAPEPDPWRWESAHENRELVISFVRGSVEIRRQDGPVQIEVRRTARRSDAREATIVLTESQREVIITDVYPMRSPAVRRECLPPLDQRGDFWSSDVQLHAVVRGPHRLRVRVELMDRGPILD
jgi:hypothetical protein